MAEFEVVGRRPVAAPADPPPPDPDPGPGGFQVLDRRPAEPDPLTSNALLEKGRQILAQEESDIDYKSGAPFIARTRVQGARNPTEAYKELDRLYGKGNFGQDRFGKWWVKEGDKRVSVLPTGLLGAFKNIVSGATSAPFTTAGGIAGGVAGGVLGAGAGGVGAVPGGIIGSSAGAAAGKGLDDMMKWAMGVFAQKPAEVVTGMATEGTLAGVFQGAGPAARAIGAPVKRGIQSFLGTREIPAAGTDWTAWRPPASNLNPTAAAAAAQHPPGYSGPMRPPGPPTSAITPGAKFGRELGLSERKTAPTMSQPTRAVPPVSSYAPGATSLKAKQELRDILAGPRGSAAERTNTLYLNARMRGILSKEGYTEDQINTIMRDVEDTSWSQSTREAGTAIVGRAQGQFTALMDDFNTSRQAASDMLDQQTATLEQMSRAPSNLSQNVADAIVHERRTFGRTYGQTYASIDRMGGNLPIVPTAELQATAQQVVHVTPPTAVPPIIRDAAQGRFVPAAESMVEGEELGDVQHYITFQQAHTLRTLLRELGEPSDLAAQGLRPAHLRGMAAAADRAIQQAEGRVGQRAAEALRTADAGYREGIRRFYNASVKKLVRDLESGIVPEPEAAAKLIMKPDNINLAREVLSMLPHAARRGVIQADLSMMLQAAQTTNKAGRSLIDGQSLLRALDDRHRLLSATYPPDMLVQLRRYAAQVAAFDGQIDATALRDPSQITTLLRQSAGAYQAAEEMVRRSPLRAFINGTPMEIDAALRHATRPGNEAVTDSIAKALGVNSEAWKAVQRYSLQKLFGSSVVELKSLGKTVAGDEIDKALRRFTPRQQELLFPGGLADDLRLLAKEARYLFPGGAGGDIGSSMAARSIQYGLPTSPWALFKFTRTMIAGYIADHPRVLKYLTDEVRNDPVRGRRVLSVMGQWMLTRQMQGPGRGKAPPPPEPEPEPTKYGGTDAD